MFTEAIAQFQHALRVAPSDPRLVGGLGHADALAGKRSGAEEYLNELSLQSRQRYVSPYDLAIVYLGLLEQDQALACLERAAAERSFWVIWLNADPRFDLIRDARRYKALTRRIYLKT